MFYTKLQSTKQDSKQISCCQEFGDPYLPEVEKLRENTNNRLNKHVGYI